MNNSENISLTELQRVIRDKLYEAFPGFYNVVAEIAEIKVNSSGHCYLELTDNEGDDNKVTARVRATIWAKRYRIVNAMFESIAGISLQAGIKILVKATVEYHELYGLSLNITDIDPKYTVGEIAVRRDAIIRRLASEGILGMNQSLEMPLYPRRIAVISSSGAAGYQDFVRQLSSNMNGFFFVTELFESAMQGSETEASVMASLDRIASHADDYDAVAIIRGGGSQTDLAWFDNYNVAYLITQFPLPVVTGIGHDKDMTVADIVAWKALKTPTAVADFFISHTLKTEMAIGELASVLVTSTRRQIIKNRESLFMLRHRILTSSQALIKQHITETDNRKDKLQRSADIMIQMAKEHTESLGRELSHLNPMNVLKRGYTITSLKGKIIHDPAELCKGDKITTHFEKGTTESSIEKITGK